MKNLKKVLSLALAFAMVLGLCVGAMAAEAKDVTKLTDWADVTQKDAAQLLNAFGIMQGDDKGNFNPAKDVTRAEAVKMIDTALWHGKDESARYAGSGLSTFTDIAGNEWYAGHVVYATTLGIVSGYPDGTFKPKGSVTGYELLKMALTALGYDQEIEGLTGTSWKVNTMALAMGGNGLTDLTDGVEVTSWDLPISRDNTAKVVANMIWRATVKYDRDGYLVVNTKTVDSKDVNVSFGEQYLGVTTATGVLVANTYGTIDNNKLSEEAAKKFNSIVAYKDDKDEEQTIPVNSDSGLFELGSKATVYLSNGVAVSTVVTPATPITSATPQYDGEDAQNEFTIGTAPAAGTFYAPVFNFDADGNGKVDTIMHVNFSTPEDVKEVVETENFGTIYQTNNAVWSDLYDKAGANLRPGFTAMKTIAGNAPAKGDKIMYAVSTDATGEDVNVGVALETVEGAVSRVNGTNYYIDGTAYTIGDSGSVASSLTVGFGNTGVFYTYPGSTIILGKDLTVKSDDKVALLYDAGLVASNKGTSLGATATKPVVSVAAILPDGTTGTYVVTKFGSNDLTTDEGITNTFNTQNSGLYGLPSTDWNGVITGLNNASDGTADQNYIVKYTLDDDGNMKITGVVTADGVITGADNGTAITTSTANVTVGRDTKLITSETVTFIQSKTNGVESWAAYTGRHAYTIAENQGVSVVLTDYNGATKAAVKYAVVSSTALGTAAPATSDFYYVIAVNGQIADDKVEFVVYDASADEVKTVTTTLSGATGVKKGNFYGTYDGKTFGTPKEYETKGYVTGIADNILVLSGFAPKAEPDTGYKDYGTIKAIVVDTDTKYFVLGDETNSEKITMADVVAQAPATLPKTDDQQPPYQAIVVVGKDGIADTVILFAEEQPAIAKAAK